MHTRWIALQAIAAGLGLSGVAIFVQVDSRAFTSAVTSAAPESISAVRVVPPASPPISNEIEESAAPSRTIDLPPIHITVKHPPAPAPETAPLNPCSPWREIGPTHVVDGVANGVQRVRELC